MTQLRRNGGSIFFFSFSFPLLPLPLSLSLLVNNYDPIFKVNLQSEIQSRFHLHSPEQIASSSSSVDIPFISTHHSLIQTEEEQQVMTTPPSAFTRYYQPEPLIVASTHRNSNSLFARSLSFFRNLNARNSLQMHHAITERRRRQKQSHSFHILRHLVPQVSKVYIYWKL